MAHKKSPPPIDSRDIGDPRIAFTMDEVRALAEELGVSDETKINVLMEQLMHIAIWAECAHEIFDSRIGIALVRRKLGLLEAIISKLLKQFDDMDYRSKEALAEGVRRCWRRGDPRVCHVNPRFVLGASTAMRAMRNTMDLLRDATQRAIEVTPRGDGRPRRMSLNQTVLELAQLYEDLSGKRFAREKDRGVWSVGAEWVAKAARMLAPRSAPQPTRSELNTAMRYAARALRTGPRVYVPWRDESLSDSEDLQEPPT